MSTSMFSRSFILLTLAMTFLTGCAQLGALSRANHIERSTRINQLRFLERVSDAYFLIGNEYYKLAVEAEERGDMEKKQEYADKAGVYLLFCKNIRQDAEDLRTALEAQAEEGWREDLGIWPADRPTAPVAREDQTFAAPDAPQY